MLVIQALRATLVILEEQVVQEILELQVIQVLLEDQGELVILGMPVILAVRVPRVMPLHF